MMRKMVVLFLMMAAVPAFAADPQLSGEYQKWLVYHYDEPGGPVCYAMTRAMAAMDAKGKPVKIRARGQVLLQVTRRVAEGKGLVFSYVAGQTIKSKTDVLITAGKSHFHLRGDGDTAWTNDPSDDANIVAAIGKAKTIAAVHQDRKGNMVTDTFSVKGAAAALGALGQCE